MTCKPESQKQRLERIAVQILAGLGANPQISAVTSDRVSYVHSAISVARELIKQLDALPIDE